MPESSEPAAPAPKARISKLVIAVIVLLVIIPIVWIGFSIVLRLNILAHNMWCWEHFKNLELALKLYSHDNGKELPLPEMWCDIVHAQCDISLKDLNCVESDTINGESAYAMNENAVGRKLNELPPDMVFLFESDKGKEQPRSLMFTERAFVKSLKKNRADKYQNIRVYPLRWNQLGGPDDAAFRHPVRKQKCGHVLFVNGEIKLVGEEKIHTLRWTADKQ